MRWRDEARKIAREEFKAIELERAKADREAMKARDLLAIADAGYWNLSQFSETLECPHCGSTDLGVAKTHPQDDIKIWPWNVTLQDAFGGNVVFARNCLWCMTFVCYERPLSAIKGRTNGPMKRGFEERGPRMRIQRQGLAHYEGFTMVDGSPKVACPDCGTDMRPSDNQLLWLYEGDSYWVEVTCAWCYCVFLCDKRTEED